MQDAAGRKISNGVIQHWTIWATDLSGKLWFTGTKLCIRGSQPLSYLNLRPAPKEGIYVFTIIMVKTYD